MHDMVGKTFFIQIKSWLHLSYGVFISQLIRYARACSSCKCFILWAMRLLYKLRRDTLQNICNRLIGSSMVDTGILSNNMKSPSPKCHMPIWDMIMCSDTLQWLAITVTRDVVIELEIFTFFYLLTKCSEISIDHLQRVRITSGHPVPPNLGLAYVVYMMRPCSLSWSYRVFGLWVSGVPRYVYITFQTSF